MLETCVVDWRLVFISGIYWHMGISVKLLPWDGWRFVYLEEVFPSWAGLWASLRSAGAQWCLLRVSQRSGCSWGCSAHSAHGPTSWSHHSKHIIGLCAFSRGPFDHICQGIFVFICGLSQWTFRGRKSLCVDLVTPSYDSYQRDAGPDRKKALLLVYLHTSRPPKLCS